jgi:hypothetical protein
MATYLFSPMAGVNSKKRLARQQERQIKTKAPPTGRRF